jgi:hypothetical protein
MEPNQKNNFDRNLEAEIAVLSQEIEAKRRLLMEQKGVIEEKELVRDVLRERVYPAVSAVTASTQPAVASVPAGANKDYLDNLDSATIVRVNELVAQVGTSSLAAAISAAQKEPANVLDAFHDTLVNRLYEDLKQRGVVS